MGLGSTELWGYQTMSRCIGPPTETIVPPRRRIRGCLSGAKHTVCLSACDCVITAAKLQKLHPREMCTRGRCTPASIPPPWHANASPPQCQVQDSPLCNGRHKKDVWSCVQRELHCTMIHASSLYSMQDSKRKERLKIHWINGDKHAPVASVWKAL